MSEQNIETTPTKEEAIQRATSTAMRHVMSQGPRLSPLEMQDAYSKGMIPDGIDGESAQAVMRQLHSGMGSLTPEQSKWFALGVAAQANTTAALRDLEVEQ